MQALKPPHVTGDEPLSRAPPNTHTTTRGVEGLMYVPCESAGWDACCRGGGGGGNGGEVASKCAFRKCPFCRGRRKNRIVPTVGVRLLG
eukprot:scaffold270589_cov27-Tisochrysis_lutea.AAC.1